MAALVGSISPPPQKEVVGPELPPLTNGKTEVCAVDIVMEGSSSPTLPRPTPRKQPGKRAFVNPTEEEMAELFEQVQLRVTEGQGEAFFDIGLGNGSGCGSGLTEEELTLSLATLEQIAVRCKADLTVLRRKVWEAGLVAECLVRARMGLEDFMEIRVAVVGNVDAGKSTLLGVLTHGELDNGRGIARQKLFRHKHEMESGRTSSVGNDILGYDSKGAVVNKPDGRGVLDWEKLCRESAKVVTFIDLAGHERYLKTTIFGMTGHSPDFCMLMIGANAGIIGMTKEHLGLALALSVPVFVVVTKIDMCPPNVLRDNMKLLVRILKSPGCRKIPVMVSTQDDVITSALNFTSERVCPIFQVSNVTGENLGLLKSFVNLLTARMPPNSDKPAEFQIDETYYVPGVGTVVSGTCMQGRICLGDTLLLGPMWNGEFQPVPIRSIHRKRLPVTEVRGGQTASFALKKYKRNQIRKGMVLVAAALNPESCWEFEGDILVLHHPTTISCKYQAMVHCGSTRQTASIIRMDKEHLRTGDKASCHFRFIKNPEFLKPGTRMVFREGRTKAIGSVTKIYPIVAGASQMIGAKLKPSTKHFLHRPGAQGGGGNRGRRRGGKKHSKGPQLYPTPVHVPKDMSTPPSLNPLVVSNPPQKEDP